MWKYWDNAKVSRKTRSIHHKRNHDKAGVKQEDILYVGDSNVDMQTAHHAGVTAIGVAWGFRPRTELEALHPAHIIEKAEELLPLLLS